MAGFKSIIVLVLFAFISACSSPPKPLPQAFLDADQLLRSGTQAFYNDEYSNAAKNFTQALQLYQSIDDSTGIIKTQINLVETHLAMGQLEAAQSGLQQLDYQLSLTPVASQEKRANLLQAKLVYKKNQPDKAITLLKELAPKFNAQQQAINPDTHSLAIVSTLARFTQQTGSDDSDLWIARFEKLISNDDNDTYRALLMRLKVRPLIEQQQFNQAQILLDQALELDRKQAYRRGLSESLSLKAEIMYRTDQLLLADQLYQRALNVQLWIMDRTAARHSLQQLTKINRQLERDQQAEHYLMQLNQL